MYPCLSEDEVKWAMESATEENNAVYLDREAALKIEPELGPLVLGALLEPSDSHINPKKFMRELL